MALASRAASCTVHDPSSGSSLAALESRPVSPFLLFYFDSASHKSRMHAFVSLS